MISELVSLVMPPGGGWKRVAGLVMVLVLLPSCAAVMTRSDYNVFVVPAARATNSQQPQPALQPKPPALEEKYSHRFELTLLERRLFSPTDNHAVQLAYEQVDGSGSKRLVAHTDDSLWIVSSKGEVLREFVTPIYGYWDSDKDGRNRRFTWDPWPRNGWPSEFRMNVLDSLPATIPYRSADQGFRVDLVPALATATSNSPLYFEYPEFGRWIKTLDHAGNVVDSRNLLLPTWQPEMLMTDLDGDGSAETLFAARDTGSLLCFGPDGQLKWSRTFIGPFVKMKAFDLLGDGKKELFLLTTSQLMIFAPDGGLLRRFTVVGAPLAGWSEHAMDVALAHTQKGARVAVAIGSRRNEWGNKSTGGGKLRLFSPDGDLVSEFNYSFLSTASIAAGNLTGEGDDVVVIYPGLKGGATVYDLDGTPVTEVPLLSQGYASPLLITDLLGLGRDQLVVANDGPLDVYGVGGHSSLDIHDADKTPWPKARLVPKYSVSIPSEDAANPRPTLNPTIEPVGNAVLIHQDVWTEGIWQNLLTVLWRNRVSYSFTAMRAYLLESGSGVRVVIRDYNQSTGQSSLQVTDINGKTVWQKRFDRGLGIGVTVDRSRNLMRVAYRPDRNRLTSRVLYIDADGKTVEDREFGPEDYIGSRSSTRFTDSRTGQPVYLRSDGGVYDVSGRLLFHSPAGPWYTDTAAIGQTDRFWTHSAGQLVEADVRGKVYQIWKTGAWWNIDRSLTLPRRGNGPLTIMLGIGRPVSYSNEAVLQLLVLDGEHPFGQIDLTEPALDIKVGDLDGDGESEILLLTVAPDKKHLILTGYRIEK